MASRRRGLQLDGIDRRAKLSLAALLGALCLLALIASPAPAAAVRTFNSNVKEGFSQPTSIAFEENNDFWVADHGHEVESGGPKKGQNGLYEIDAFPSENRLQVPYSYGAWGYYILDLSVGVDDETGEVFVSQSNGHEVDVFTPASETNKCPEGEQERVCFTHRWTGINGVTDCCTGDMNLAIDNSHQYSRGRIYLSITAPENDVEAFDNNDHPVDFPATASYIVENHLIGTPSGRFGSVEQVSVDNNGDLFVDDAGKEVVDEFDSTGTYLRSFPSNGGAAADPISGNVVIANGQLTEYDASGNLLGTVSESSSATAQPEFNSNGYLYSPMGFSTIGIFNPATPVAKISYGAVTNPTETAGTLNATVDPNGGGPVTECKFEYGTSSSYSGGSVPCSPTPPYSGSPEAVSANLTGLTTATTYHYRVVAKDGNGVKYGEDQTYTPGPVLALGTDPATQIGESGATLNASFVGNGEETHYYFEYGQTKSYGLTTASAPGPSAGSPSGPSRTAVAASLSGLPFYTTYHYRVVATDGKGTSYGSDAMFTTTPGLPTGRNPGVTEVHSDRAVMHGEIDPDGAPTTARFEFVPQASFEKGGWAEAESAPSSGIEVGMGKQYSSVSTFVNGLQQGTLYHYRVEGTNSTGSGGAESTFVTFPFIPAVNDPCPNAHVRQQTGAGLLLDCRGYELVSAANSGGYDVESSLVAGQTPFGSYPDARSPSGEPQVLYGVHDGGIPGTGNPTNRGVDPYLATRTEQGWTTRYVGIPADNKYATSPFSSTLLEATPNLETLAFGGPEICSPCFSDGSAGTPIHLPDGELAQGMTGSVPHPSAQPAGFIGRHLSADGAHFVFGSQSRFEPDGNEGEISIYDRNLDAHETHVVSKTPSGQTMKEEGEEIGELDISSDGTRIVFGHLVSESGNAKYWHLYMDVGDSSKSIDLTPGTTSGVLFDGMTADGSKVFFTTADQLTGEDRDHSADIYEAEMSGESATLHLISKGNNAGAPGEPGNSDSCDPAGDTRFEHWNTTGTEENCGVLAVGGGGGVASNSGAIYFLSPELLDGPSKGVESAPNLYVATSSSTPHFVATLESGANAPLPPAKHPFIRKFGEFAHVAGTAMDDATGDIYVFDIGGIGGVEYSAFIYKFNPAGHPVLSFGTNGKLEIANPYGSYNLPCSIAVDNDPSSPNYGDLYVPSVEGGVLKYQGREEPGHKEGEHLETIEVPDLPTGVAVDPTNGNVYVSGFFSLVHEYNTSGVEINNFETIENPTGVAVDSTGKVYVVDGGGFGAKGTTEMYSSSGTDLGQLDGNPSYAVAVDPADDHVYVDEGNQVAEFNPSGEEVGVPTGSGALLKSFGVSADAGTLAIGNPSEIDVQLYGPAFVPSDPSTDNPLVIDSDGEPGIPHSGDFETTPSGQYAAFTSSMPLTGYDNTTHREVFSYNDVADATSCASCNPTGEQATNDASMAPEGLSLTKDDRVFFNTAEGLVDRDLNNKIDAYEWEPEGYEFDYEEKGEQKSLTCEEPGGCVQLISSGTAALGSALLGASSDGADAFFFTRDSLVSSDLSGNRVKVYDARSLGGYGQIPPPHQCQASDECHGPGSATPPPPAIKSISETPGGNESPPPPVKCRKGFSKKHGHCVKRRKHRHHQRAHHRS